MFDFERKFDTAFDDVFQKQKFLNLFDCRPLDGKAFKRRFTLGYFLENGVKSMFDP